MSNTSFNKLILSAIFVLLSTGQSNAVELLVLKGEESPSPDTLSEARRVAAEYLEKKRREMRENGYLKVNRGEYGQEAAILSNEDKLTTDLASITSLRFKPLDVSRGPLTGSTYLGAYDPLQGQQENSDYVVQLFDHPSLGRISIEEYSYITDIERTRYAIATPPNNVDVLGYPAGYVVLRLEDNLDIGKSQIWFVTEEKHITLSAYKPIEQNSADFGRLQAVAFYLATQ